MNFQIAKRPIELINNFATMGMDFHIIPVNSCFSVLAVKPLSAERRSGSSGKLVPNGDQHFDVTEDENGNARFVFVCLCLAWCIIEAVIAMLYASRLF